MSAAISLTAVLLCTLVPVGDMTIPAGTVPVVSITLSPENAETLNVSQDTDFEFSVPKEKFGGEEPRRELLLLGRSPFGPGRYQITRISKQPDFQSPLLIERGRLYWLDFQLGEAAWDEDRKEFEFTHQFDGACKLQDKPGMAGEATP